MADADLIYHDKGHFADGAIVEMTIWRLPEPDAERPHGLKYSLYYGKSGRRILGFGNERGKGDHRHLGDQELSYAFTSMNQLIADFISEVRRIRGDQ